MHARLARWTLAIAAALMLPGIARAQNQTQVVVGGVVYSQYQYLMKDPSGHNRFDVTRAYINLLGKFAGGVTTRVTADIFTNTDSSRAYRIKYAYVGYTPTNSALTFKLGEIHTPFIDWEEALWDYRMQGQMALERGGYMSSSDFGFGIDGKWGVDQVNAQFTIVNGENYNKGTGDSRKDVMARVSARVMYTDDSSRVGGLRLTAYGQIGQPTTGGTRDRFLGMASYRSKRFTLAAEYARTIDSVTAALTKTKGSVISAFGVYKVPNSKVAAIGRVDITDPNTAAGGNKQTREIVGLSYQLSPNLRLLGDFDHVKTEGAVTGPTGSQALFQIQFTF